MTEQTQTPKCPQCGQPMTTPVTRTIYRRDRDPYTRKAYNRRSDMQFCSEKCGGHYQMGCEG